MPAECFSCLLYLCPSPYACWAFELFTFVHHLMSPELLSCLLFTSVHHLIFLPAYLFLWFFSVLCLSLSLCFIFCLPLVISLLYSLSLPSLCSILYLSLVIPLPYPVPFPPLCFIFFPHFVIMSPSSPPLLVTLLLCFILYFSPSLLLTLYRVFVFNPFGFFHCPMLWFTLYQLPLLYHLGLSCFLHFICCLRHFFTKNVTAREVNLLDLMFVQARLQ